MDGDVLVGGIDGEAVPDAFCKVWYQEGSRWVVAVVVEMGVLGLGGYGLGVVVEEAADVAGIVVCLTGAQWNGSNPE